MIINRTEKWVKNIQAVTYNGVCLVKKIYQHRTFILFFNVTYGSFPNYYVNRVNLRFLSHNGLSYKSSQFSTGAMRNILKGKFSFVNYYLPKFMWHFPKFWFQSLLWSEYSCNKITKTWIQITRQNWFDFFSNISHQMTFWLTPIVSSN